MSAAWMAGSVERSVQGRETVFRWRIPDVSSLHDDEDEEYDWFWEPEYGSWMWEAIYESYEFGDVHRDWCLHIFPKGPTDRFLVLCLQHDGWDPSVSFLFQVGIGTKGGETERWGSGRHTFKDNDRFVEVRGIPKSQLLRRRDELLPGGQLTIVVTLEELGAPSTGNQDVCVQTEVEGGATGCLMEKTAVRKMKEDMMNLLATGEDSDVIVKVRGKEFPAHKNILRARSSVFKTMFEHDTLVEIDCDPEIFRDFLTYVYTGSTRHIHGENVCSLYASSDKYCVDELREACVIFMKNNLSVETFSDVASLALLYSEKKLLVTVTDFFCQNFRKIMRSPKWETFLHENTEEANALLMKAVSA